MGGLILFRQVTGSTLGRLCRRLWLLAGLAVLCAALPLLAGRAAEESLSDGTAFSGVTLAVTSPEGETLPERLAQAVGSMADVARYCRVEAMEQAEALDALAAGQVTAVLELPEDFVRGVQSGENPDLRIIVDGGRPLESLLTLWVGQSAADLLAATQAGIYAVLDAYDPSPPADLPRDRAVMEINLRYAQWVLNRADLFREERLLPTDTLPIGLHYELSLLAFLVLSTAPAFAWIYQEPWISGFRRLRYARRSPLWGFGAGLASCWLMMTAVTLVVMVLLGLPTGAALGAAAVWSAFFAAWTAVCALLTGSGAGCGGLSFLLALGLLAVSGGIVPPVLLPEAVRRLTEAVPIAWMRALAAEPLGYDVMARPAWTLALAAGALCIPAGWLYVRRMDRREAAE